MRLGTSIVIAAFATAGAQAQTSPLYALNSYSGATFVVQGGSLVNSFTRADPLYTSAVAISGDIRTVGHTHGSSGSRYALNGAPLGGAYTNNTSTAPFYDGGTDGHSYNYSLRYGTNQVWRFDRNWQNGAVLLNLPGVAADAAGVTYNTQTGGFFISGYSQLAYYDSLGVQVWTRGHEGGVPAQFGVAYDPADDTIWTVGNLLHAGWFQQYTSGGVFLQEFYLPQLASSNTLGLEFNIPAPASAAILGLGGLFATRRR